MAGDWLSNAGSFLTGGLSEDDYGKLPQAAGPDKNAYQIGGMDDYKNTLGGLGGQIPGTPDMAGVVAPQMQDNEALQKYFQAVALGQAPTAADQMFHNAAAQNARQAQSAGVSMGGGMNPALAMRQILGAQSGGMGDIAGKAAQQKLQQQEDFAGLAQRGGDQLVARKMQVAQQTYEDGLRTVAAKKDIADGIFNASRAQTAYNVDFDKNKQAVSQIARMEAKQKAEDLARSRAAIVKAGVGGTMAALGGVMTATGFGAPVGIGLMGAGGGMMGGALGGGGGGGMDPAMLQMLMKQGGGTMSRGDAASLGEGAGYLEPGEGLKDWDTSRVYGKGRGAP